MMTNQELDEFLCKTYPKMFRDRHAPMTQTCLCWGLEIGDGWANILLSLCDNIQWHIDESRKTRARAIKFNRAMKRALGGDTTELIRLNSFGGAITKQTLELVDRAMTRANPYRDVPDACHQVVVTQVKEKYGTLRFYYSGGDEYISGLVNMAESMSECTCEQCGAPGELNSGGWLSVKCDTHRSELDKYEVDE